MHPRREAACYAGCQYMPNSYRFLLLLLFAGLATAASPDRITRPVDASQRHVIAGSIPHQARPQDDRGPVDDSMPMNDLILMPQPSAAQQADLDGLLADQQNPASPSFHQWLTP